MFALVDANCHYVSCERLFRPDLRNKPVVVVSNNDGCVVSRSDEAKACGVEMGAPLFKIKDLVKSAGVHVFSSNYALYGDLSDRMMSLLREAAPSIEVYSIDECFCDLRGISDLRAWGLRIREQVLREIGIPVCVGVGRTKTLAKVANRVAKKFKTKTAGVHILDSTQLEAKALRWMDVGDVWGIGGATSAKLQRFGIDKAWEFTLRPEQWVRKTFGVVTTKTWCELRGVPTSGLVEVEAARKTLCTSRSLEHPFTQREAMEEVLATFASRTAAKLRERRLCASGLSVFMSTDGFRKDLPQYAGSRSGGFGVQASSTMEVVSLALKLGRAAFKEGHSYKRLGVLALDLVPETVTQCDLFDAFDRDRLKRLQASIDGVVKKWGRESMGLAVEGNREAASMRREHLSQRFTTAWSEILEIRMDR